ncbi:16962_t:CDS:2 [Funneliformis geosporum]|uniref:16962_t:CDS:1 n=1 Tax=Funneliformis geosporum TaxID=1117311 RepID=A0A9W4SR96_9GLOM|nr:16962_t:CDS:2 [Funneliformis geosporum]
MIISELEVKTADARRQQRRTGVRSYSSLSWSQIFNPSSYYTRNGVNSDGGRNGYNNIDLTNTNNTPSSPFLDNNHHSNRQSSSNAQPPSYEEAIQRSLNPSTVNIAPLARSTINYQPLNRVVISDDESQPLLSNSENVVHEEPNRIDDNHNNKLIDVISEEEIQNYNSSNLGGPSSSSSLGVPLTNLSSSNERSIPQGFGVYGENDGIPPPPEYTLSDATYERNINGITSHDPKLNSEPESLLRFFMEHNDKPEMAIKIHGYHMETQDDSYTSTDSDGNTTVHYQTRTVEVTDFNFTFDLSEHVSINGIIHTIPNKLNKRKDVMELLNEYVKHGNRLKNIEMKKVVIWDYESLTKAISTVIRQQGYRNDLRITFPLRNHIIRVESDHKFARFTRNIWTKILCFITCLWIIFYPILWLYRNSFKNQIRSNFFMHVSERDWFDRNVDSIVANVRWL